MVERGTDELHSGDALVTFDADLRVLSWNASAEALTGVPADEAVGRRCWEVLGGSEESGAIVCHAGCSYARLAREGWPVPLHEITIKTSRGPKQIALSTIALRGAERPFFAHLMFDADGDRAEEPQNTVGPARRPALTPRQQQVLELLSEGVPAKEIARKLGVTQTTARNHIRAVLLELGCHSQLAAVAEARRLGIVRD